MNLKIDLFENSMSQNIKICMGTFMGQPQIQNFFCTNTAKTFFVLVFFETDVYQCPGGYV